jgi:hypothetical protein
MVLLLVIQAVAAMKDGVPECYLPKDKLKLVGSTRGLNGDVDYTDDDDDGYEGGSDGEREHSDTEVVDKNDPRPQFRQKMSKKDLSPAMKTPDTREMKDGRGPDWIAENMHKMLKEMFRTGYTRSVDKKNNNLKKGNKSKQMRTASNA